MDVGNNAGISVLHINYKSGGVDYSHMQEVVYWPQCQHGQVRFFSFSAEKGSASTEKTT